MEKMDSELTATKRKIDQTDDYAIPRLEKQLQQVQNDLGIIERKRLAMNPGSKGNFGQEFLNSTINKQNLKPDPFASPLNQSHLKQFISPDRRVNKYASGNSLVGNTS